MECSVTWSVSTTMLFFISMISLPVQVISRADSVLHLSDLCTSECGDGMLCVEQTTVCTFDDCPVVRSCIARVLLPSHLLRESIRAEPGMQEVSPKPGCPATMLGSPCVTQCQRDSDCRRNYLCCSSGCGKVCKPDNRAPSLPKRGSCPWYLIGSEESCDNNCQDDHECPGMQKCCQTSCGSTCSTPCFYWLSGSSLWRLSSRCDRTATHSRRSHELSKRKTLSQPSATEDDLLNPWSNNNNIDTED